MSVTKTANDHSYFYLQRAKVVSMRQRTFKCNYASWDGLPTTRDYYEDLARKILMNCWHCGTELIWGGDHDLEVSVMSMMW